MTLPQRILQTYTQTPKRHAAFLLCAVALFLVAAFWPAAALQAAPPVRTMPLPQPLAPAPAPDDLYNRAKMYHERLLHDHGLGGERDNWLECLRQFRRVQFMRQGDELTANSLFMQGRLYREMYERFRTPLDLDNAIVAFNSVATSFPESQLADDALYYSAIASLLYPARRGQARGLLYKVIRDYPDSDHAAPAAELLRQMANPATARAAQQPAPSTARITSPTVADTGNAAAAQTGDAEASRPPGQYPVDTRTRIDPVKHWSSDDYTRVVIPAAAAVPYTTKLLEARDGHPPRLVIDFAGSVLAPDNREPHAIGDGLLKQVRTGQFTLDTVRVVLDIESLSDYRIFSLPEPFRVIVDVHGRKRSAPPPAEPPPAATPETPKRPESPATPAQTRPGRPKPTLAEGLPRIPDTPARPAVSAKPAEPARPQVATVGAGLGERPATVTSVPTLPAEPSRPAVPAVAEKPAVPAKPAATAPAQSDRGQVVRTVGIAPKGRTGREVHLLTRLPESARPEPAAGDGVIALVDQKKSPPDAAPFVPAVPAAPAPMPRKDAPFSLAQQLGLGIRHIVIDPGHGGKDPGAMANGLKEKDVVLKLARKVAEQLKERHGYEVSLTREGDVFIPLEERTAIANTRKADLFLSLHLNAHPSKQAGGVETYFLNLATDADAMRVAALENASSTRSIGELQDILQDLLKNTKIDESQQLARFIQRNLARGLKQDYRIKNLGVKQAPFYVLIGAEMPAVLIEASFITNPAEAKLLQQDAYLDKIAVEIANGLNTYAQHHHSAALTY